MKKPLRILIAEDDPADAELVLRELRRAGFDPDWHRVDTKAAFLDRLHPDLDVILSDYEIPGFGGLIALETLHERGLDVPFIIVSGTIGEDTAVAVMKHGATDYLLKDRLARLGPAVEHAMEKGRLLRERREAEAALRESEERFRQMAENIQDAFWLTDPTKNQMLYISPAYETIWGRTCAELYTSPRAWLDAIHPDDRKRVLHAAVTKQTAGGYDEEYRIVRPDGSVRWIRDRAFPVASALGKVDRVAGVARDITERRRAEEGLKESERRFREMLENVELIAMTADKRGVVTFCNDYLVRLSGWKREEIVGADWFEKFIPETCPEVKELFFETIEAGKIPSHYENPIKTRTGELREIVWNNTMLRDAAGKIIGTASIGEDVTERRRGEEAIKQRAAELEQFHRLSVGRELQMIELKKEVNELAKLAGRTQPYDLSFLEKEAGKGG